MKKIKRINDVSKKIVKEIGKGVGIANDKTPSRIEIRLREFYFRMLFYIFISIITGFVLMPYMYYKYSHFKYKNAYIDNRRLIFKGEVIDVYISFIFGYILYMISLIGLNFAVVNILPLINFQHEIFNTLITTLINVLPTILFTTFIVYRFYKWQQLNVYFVSDQDSKSYYEIHLVKTALYALINKLISVFTFGFGRPATVKYRFFYLINRQFYSDKKLKFNGLVSSAYGWLFWRYYLVVFTFGLYLPIYIYKENEWVITHTHLSNKKHSNHKISIL